MRIKIYILFAILAFTFISAKAQIRCGTQTVIPNINFDSLANVPKSTLSAAVPVKIHIIRNSNGTAGADYAIIQDNLHSANSDFNGSGIQFMECGAVEYIDNSTLYNFDRANSETSLVQYNATNVLNIYFVNTVTTNGLAVGGYSFFPWYPDPSSHYIIIAMSNYDDSETLTHEMGHFFGLYHTHETGNGVEYVNGINCATAGDMICDTPADPGCSGCVSSCQYSPGVGCPINDPLGAAYDPPTFNLMSYSDPGCRFDFTNNQKTRIGQFYQSYRTYLTCNVLTIGENCIWPIPLTSNGSCVSTQNLLLGKLPSYPEISIPTCSGEQSPFAYDIWYSFIADAPVHTIQVSPAGWQNPGNDNYVDPVIALYAECSDNGFIQCEDDPGGGAVKCVMNVTGLTVGNRYYIRVYDYNETPELPSNTIINTCITTDAHDFFASNLVLNDSGFKPGDALNISVRQNTVSVNTPEDTVHLEYTLRDLADNLIQSLGGDTSMVGVGSGMYDTETLNTTFPSGLQGLTCKVCAEANYDLATPELDITNNRVCQTVAIINLANTVHDFFPVNLTLNATSFEASDPITISVDQYTAAPSAQLRSPYLEYTLRNANGVVLQQLGTDQSSVGGTSDHNNETLSTTYPFSQPCPLCQICAEANYTHSVTESDTTNNLVCQTINANMNAVNYTVNITSSPAGAGSTFGNGLYTDGSEVTIAALGSSSWQFVNWTEDNTVISTQPGMQFTATSNRSLVANFISLVGVEETGPGYDFVVYPNPANEQITISFNKNIDCTIALQNLLGQTLYQTKYNGKNAYVNLAGYPASVYMVRITDDKGNVVTKRVVHN